MKRVVHFLVVLTMCAAALGAAGLYVSGRSGRTAALQDQARAKAGEAHAEDGVELSDAQVAAAGIELLKASPGELRANLRLNGVIQPNQEALVQVTPRFPGVVKDVRARLGDKVAKGDLLATVESNQSLTTYELRAPIAGTIVDRQAALGEFVSEQRPVFVVADLSTVWVDFSVYRRDFNRVHVGLVVTIEPQDGNAPIAARIDYVSPLGSSETQSALARAVVAGTGWLRPGLFVTGRILLSPKPVDVAIRLDALQTFEGRLVVFVRDGDRFEARRVRLGGRDADQVEVLSGLRPGDVYAAKNSFVVKAELGKRSAAHEH
jgi:membrane fusion protein, heavy metal efflux system